RPRGDLVVLLDVGGDVLATGSEPGLSSPLCDALLLASAAHLPERIAVLGCAFGAGCHGGPTLAEVRGWARGADGAGGARAARGPRSRPGLDRDRLTRRRRRPGDRRRRRRGPDR